MSRADERKEFQRQLDMVMAKMRELGHPMKIVSKKRDAREQKKHYDKGRDASGKVVDPKKVITEADGTVALSRHQGDLAADLAFLVNGQPSFGDDQPWDKLGKVAKDLGLNWGGEWGDLGHVQRGEGLLTPQDLEDDRSLAQKLGDVFSLEGVNATPAGGALRRPSPLVLDSYEGELPPVHSSATAGFDAMARPPAPEDTLRKPNLRNVAAQVGVTLDEPPPAVPTPRPNPPAPASPVPEPVSKMDQVLADPDFSRFAPEAQLRILASVVGPEAAVAHAAVLRGSPALRAGRPGETAYEPSTASQALERITERLGLPSTMSRGTPTLGERPLGEGDVAAAARGAMVATAPMAAPFLAALPVRASLAMLGLGGAGGIGGGVAGRELGEEAGLPETGALAGETVGGLAGGLAGVLAAPKAPPTTAELASGMGRRVLAALRNRPDPAPAPQPRDFMDVLRSVIADQRPDIGELLGNLPRRPAEPVAPASRAVTALERGQLAARGPVRGRTVVGGPPEELPPAGERIAKTPQELEVERRAATLRQPEPAPASVAEVEEISNPKPWLPGDVPPDQRVGSEPLTAEGDEAAARDFLTRLRESIVAERNRRGAAPAVPASAEGGPSALNLAPGGTRAAGETLDLPPELEAAIRAAEAAVPDAPPPAAPVAVPNASAESAASAEAVSRQASMRGAGRQFVVYDRAGNERPLIGPDAVDYVAQEGETYGIKGPGGFQALDSRGGKVPAAPEPAPAIAPPAETARPQAAPAESPATAPAQAAAETLRSEKVVMVNGEPYRIGETVRSGPYKGQVVDALWEDDVVPRSTGPTSAETAGPTATISGKPYMIGEQVADGPYKGKWVEDIKDGVPLLTKTRPGTAAEPKLTPTPTPKSLSKPTPKPTPAPTPAPKPKPPQNTVPAEPAGPTDDEAPPQRSKPALKRKQPSEEEEMFEAAREAGQATYGKSSSGLVFDDTNRRVIRVPWKDVTNEKKLAAAQGDEPVEFGDDLPHVDTFEYVFFPSNRKKPALDVSETLIRDATPDWVDTDGKIYLYEPEAGVRIIEGVPQLGAKVVTAAPKPAPVAGPGAPTPAPKSKPLPKSPQNTVPAEPAGPTDDEVLYRLLDAKQNESLTIKRGDMSYDEWNAKVEQAVLDNAGVYEEQWGLPLGSLKKYVYGESGVPAPIVTPKPKPTPAPESAPAPPTPRPTPPSTTSPAPAPEPAPASPDDLRANYDGLVEVGAEDIDFKDILPNSAQGPLNRGETWRGRVEAAIKRVAPPAAPAPAPAPVAKPAGPVVPKTPDSMRAAYEKDGTVPPEFLAWYRREYKKEPEKADVGRTIPRWFAKIGAGRRGTSGS